MMLRHGNFRSNHWILFAVVALFVFVSGCHKRVAKTTAPTPPPKPAPAPVVASAAPAPKPAPAPAPQPSPGPSVAQLFQQNVRDAYFDYDKAALSDADRAALTRDAEFLRSYPSVSFVIEGHCDERGSEEYNLGLGDRRASSAKRYLVDLGIADSRIQTTSFGKERPFCTQESESCWSQNRRAHFTLAQ